MSQSRHRAVFGAFAFFVAVATLDVSFARAQLGGGQIESTACAAGTLVACGTRDIMQCETRLSLDANIFNRTGGIQYSYTVCQKAGQMQLFKDKRQFTGGGGGAPRSCRRSREGDDNGDVGLEDESDCDEG